MAKVYDVKTGPGQLALFTSSDRTKANEYADRLKKEGKTAIVVLNPFGTIPENERNIKKPKTEKPKEKVAKPKIVYKYAIGTRFYGDFPELSWEWLSRHDGKIRNGPVLPGMLGCSFGYGVVKGYAPTGRCAFCNKTIKTGYQIEVEADNGETYNLKYDRECFENNPGNGIWSHIDDGKKPRKKAEKPKEVPKAKELDDLEKTVVTVFRQLGKDVMNESTFTITTVIDRRWVTAKQADVILQKAIERNIIARKNKDYLILNEDYLTAAVPVDYKPSVGFIKSLGAEETKPAPKDDMRDCIRGILEKGPFEMECQYNENPKKYPFEVGEKVWFTECTDKYVILQKEDGSTYKHSSYIYFDDFLLSPDYHHGLCLNTAGGVKVRFSTVKTKRELDADKMRKIPERKKEVHGPREMVNHPKQMVNYPKRMEVHPERYYPINEDTARAAKESYSFDDYKMGSTTASYKASVDEVYTLAQEIKSQVPVSRHEEIDRLCDKYAKKYADWINRRNSNEASYPSVMIAGPAKYNWKKRDQMVAREGKMWEEYEYIKAIPDKIRNMPNAGISSDDPNAVELIEQKIRDLEHVQELMKEANAYYRKNKSLKGFPRISEINSSKDIDFYEMKGAPFPSWALSNNNANIRRYKDRLETLKKNAARETTSSECEYFEIKKDAQQNRIMLFFDGKPDEEVRNILKHNGFRWSPRNQAWQCYYTRNGELSVEYVIKALDKLNGKTTSQSRKKRR